MDGTPRRILGSYRWGWVPARSTLFILVILSILWALFFWRLLTPTPADRVLFAEGDFTQHYFAFSDYQVERLARGEFPLWNPYNHAGDPFAGNIQFVAFYPPRLLAAFISGGDWSIEAYQLEVAAHYLLASILMYGFLRILIRRPFIALAGSVLYTYSGYLTGYPMLQVSVLESVVWMPLIMMGVHLSIIRQGWMIWGCCIAGVGAALSLLGGHPQTTMHIVYLALAYLAFLTYVHRHSPADFVLRAGLFGGIGAGLAAIQLLPALEFTQLSYRVTQLGFDDKANGFMAADFLQVIWPGLFGFWSPLYLGAAGFLLVAGAALRARLEHRFWLLVIPVTLLMSLGGNTIVFDVFYNVIPGFSIFRQQERIASVLVFALVILAVYQLGWLLNRDESADHPDDVRTRIWYPRLIYGYAAFLLIAYVFIIIADILGANFTVSGGTEMAGMLAHPPSVFGFVAVIAGLFAVWYSWQRGYDGSRWLVIFPLLLLIVVDLFTIGTRSGNFVADTPENRLELRPSLADFVVPADQIEWRVDGAISLQGNSVYFRIPDIYGTGPFSLESIEELRLIPVDRFWEVLAVRYVTTADEPPDYVSLELLAYDVNYTGQEYRIFELIDPRPMAHLVYDYRVAYDNPAFAREIMADARVDLREMAITTVPLPFDLDAERPEVSEVNDFRIITPEQMEMTISTSADALLTIAVPNYPGWHATVDDDPVPIIDTYAGLIGIPIEAGESQHVTLFFRPNSVLVGGAITGATLIFTVILCFGAARIRKSSPAA